MLTVNIYVEAPWPSTEIQDAVTAMGSVPITIAGVTSNGVSFFDHDGILGIEAQFDEQDDPTFLAGVPWVIGPNPVFGPSSGVILP